MATGGKRGRDEIDSDHQDSSCSKRRQEYSEERPHNLYIIKNKLTAARLNHLKTLSSKNRFLISEIFNKSVTHIVTAIPSLERVKEILNTSDLGNVEVVSIDWLTDCFIEGKPVQVIERYRVKKTSPVSERIQYKKPQVTITEYECQRPTLLQHANPHITEALEVLEKYYWYIDHKQGDTRALAFRQASCTIKTLPKRVVDVEEVNNLHRIGKHSARVIGEIVLDGFSKEVEEIRSNSWFQCMELFTSVYGCGPTTADKWYKRGFRTIDDVTKCDDIELTESQSLGLKYYQDLSQPIPRSEVELITEVIKMEISKCCPGATVEAVGGYRRGKPHSHDVDLLLSHENIVTAASLLETVLSHLKSKDMLIHTAVTTGQNTLSHIEATHSSSAHSTYTSEGKQIKRVQFDHLDKAFCIMKLSHPAIKEDLTIFRRVDFIVTPPEQYAFSLVSWTGSKQFNRSLRRYSVRECSKTVTAHGIFDIAQRKFLPAKTERDIFDILKLKYLEPWERNC